MKRIAALLAVAVLVSLGAYAGLMYVMFPPHVTISAETRRFLEAAPDTPPAVPKRLTMALFRQLQTGASYDEVSRTLGSSGTLQSTSTVGAGSASLWEWTAPGTAITVLFTDGSLSAKAQSGLRE